MCGVQVDPTLTRADRLVGQVLGEVGELPDVFTELEINFFLLRRLLGVRTTVRLTDSCPTCTHAQLHRPVVNACFLYIRDSKPINAALSPCCGVQGGEKQGKVSKLVKNEVLMLNIGSMCTGARVIAVSALVSYKSHQLSMNKQQVDRWQFP